MRRWWRRWWRGRPRRVGKIRDALGGASVFVSAAAVRDGVGVSGVWAPVLVGSGAVVGLAENCGTVTTQPRPGRFSTQKIGRLWRK
jgi:hypothetical protein